MRSIYVHGNGGTPWLEGPLLAYDTLEKATALVEKGDCSYIGPTLEECLFYGDSPAVTHLHRRWPTSNAEYLYLFRNGRWQRARWLLPSAEVATDRQSMQNPRLWEELGAPADAP